MSEPAPKISDTKVPDDRTFEYHIMSVNATEDDVEFGVRYWATVNSVESYGVFISVNAADRWEDEVSGLIHKSKIPQMYVPEDFAEGDEVGVMLNKRKQDGDLSFEMVASLDTLRDVEFELEAPNHAPPEHLADAFNREAEEAPEPAGLAELFGETESAEPSAMTNEELEQIRAGQEELMTELETRLDALYEAIDEEQVHTEYDDLPGQYQAVLGLIETAGANRRQIVSFDLDSTGESTEIHLTLGE